MASCAKVIRPSCSLATRGTVGWFAGRPHGKRNRAEAALALRRDHFPPTGYARARLARGQVAILFPALPRRDCGSARWQRQSRAAPSCFPEHALRQEVDQGPVVLRPTLRVGRRTTLRDRAGHNTVRRKTTACLEGAYHANHSIRGSLQVRVTLCLDCRCASKLAEHRRACVSLHRSRACEIVCGTPSGGASALPNSSGAVTSRYRPLS